MAEAVDYSFTQPSAAGLAAAGIKAAGVYVGPGSEGKQLQAGERDALFSAGLSIFLLVEGATQDALLGAPKGVQHANLALADCRSLGVPTGVALITAIDFDVQANQWPACVAYQQAFNKVVRAAGFRTGIYGGLKCITWAKRDGIADILFQTYAWSGKPPVWVSGVQIQQYHNGVQIGSGLVDLCRTMTADFGQWARPLEEEDMGPWLLRLSLTEPPLPDHVQGDGKPLSPGAGWTTNGVWMRHIPSEGGFHTWQAILGILDKDVKWTFRGDLPDWGTDVATAQCAAGPAGPEGPPGLVPGDELTMKLVAIDPEDD
jgi:hypothetical protein